METKYCYKTGENPYCDCDCSYCYHENGMKDGDIIGGCGSIVHKEDNYVCPCFSRPDEWKKDHPNQSHCGINIQLRTNRCLYAVIDLGID